MKFSAVLVVASLVGCVRSSPAPVTGAWITSDSSQYSPVARFRAYAQLAPDEIRITIDSGSLYIPGELTPNPPLLMSRLYLTAILAVPDSGSLVIVQPAAGRAPAERRGWRPVATSDSVLLIDQLHYGERVAIPSVQLVIRPTTLPSGPAWIVYRIAGNAIELLAPLASGGNVQRRDHPGGVRVYACSDRDLRGSPDSARAGSLRRAYGIAC